jgi:uncharacterized protein
MELSQFFAQHPTGALAFSGGVDSSLLVWAAARYGQNWRAYYVRTAFQPDFELADAQAVAAQCGLALTVLEVDILQNDAVTANPPDRCYFCKQAIFSTILARARQDGYTLVIDGSNASDDAGDRPGMRALRELEVRSPLRECGLTKADIRRLSREAGLPTWDKPAYACLATRIPAGTALTLTDLRRVEAGEAALAELGLRDFRIRLRGNLALIQVTEAQLPLAWSLREEILRRLTPLFDQAALDLTARTPSA